METKVDSRIRILIKNMFTVRENGWEKELEEGPLKLKDLHKKVRQEQEYGEYEEYDDSKKKKKKEERKSKAGGSKHFGKWLHSIIPLRLGLTEFAEVPGDKEEDQTTQAEDDRFNDISDEAWSDICIGNYKEYLETEQPAFDTFKEAVNAGIEKSRIIYGVFLKLFDLKDEQVKKFEPYLFHVISE